jgi:hypothetical protein
MEEAMPDNSGALTPEEKQKVNAWFQQNWHLTSCPISGHQNWVLGDHIVQPVTHAGGVVIGGVSYPQIMVICGGCGYTVYMNAVIAGVVPGVQHGQ